MSSRSQIICRTGLGLALFGAASCNLDPEQKAALEDEIKAVGDATDVEFTMVHTRYDAELGGFVELPAPPTKRNPTLVEELNGSLYVLGGLSQAGKYVSAVDRYDDATETWQSVAPWPRPGLAFSAQVNGYLCMFAGYENLDKPLRPEVDCYDSRKDEWFAGPDLPERYSSAYPTVHAGRIFIVGGSDDDLKPLRSVWSYAPGDAKWQKEIPLPEGRALMGVQAVADELYVYGGFTSDSFDPHATDADQSPALLVFDAKSNAWQPRATPRYSRALYGLADVRGKLAVFFGLTSGPLIELYDPAKDEWRDGADPPKPPNGGLYVYAQLDGELYLMAIADKANSTSVGSTNALWKFDSTKNVWAVVAKRGAQHQDAVFAGVQHLDGIHWIGAHTSLGLDRDALVGKGGVAAPAAATASVSVEVEAGVTVSGAEPFDAATLEASTPSDAAIVDSD
ncbi:MAG TPA: kelch repeat-containing protein [Polyangiaceae bacterium]|jgi:N-acetylneuraminic acid mutarotase|nr:kelch repeat-containing protein [Polyangiaceae bacterium]